jgi:DNA-binding CsgD family transcriptional regulator
VDTTEIDVSHPNQSASKTEVHIRIDSDDDAARIAGVLEALGYEVLRELEEGQGSGRLDWAIDQLGRRYGLTAREREVLAGVLDGRSNASVASSLEISQATIKWHLHNVFGKTKTSNRESLLRLALQLGRPRGEPEEPRPVDNTWHEPTAQADPSSAE